MKTIRIEDFAFDDCERGTIERMWLRTVELLTGPAMLPAIVVSGQRPGRTLFAVAGVHGDEYEGMMAIRRVVAALDPHMMSGRFVAIPVANPFAYEARARIAPLYLDGLNLARVFPGDPGGSPSRQLAHQLLELVLRNVGPDDIFVDFHSGSADVPFARLIGFRDVPGASTARAEEAARHFGIEQLWRIPDSAGPFNAETARRGIVTLGTETTGRAGCDPEDVVVYERGLHNLLAHMGIVDGAPERYSHAPMTTVEVNSPATGFFESESRLHDVVEQRQQLGRIVDLFGDTIAEVEAPFAGPIWAARSMPAVRVGELLFYIAVK